MLTERVDMCLGRVDRGEVTLAAILPRSGVDVVVSEKKLRVPDWTIAGTIATGEHVSRR